MMALHTAVLTVNASVRSTRTLYALDRGSTYFYALRAYIERRIGYGRVRYAMYVVRNKTHRFWSWYMDGNVFDVPLLVITKLLVLTRCSV
jgi:hypothetical protein